MVTVLKFYLFCRRVKSLIGRDSDEAIPYCVATGDAERLVQFFTSRAQLQDAMLVAAAAEEGSIVVPPSVTKRDRQSLVKTTSALSTNNYGTIHSER